MPKNPRYGRPAARKIVEKPKGKNLIEEFKRTQLVQKLNLLEGQQSKSHADLAHIEKIKKMLGLWTPPKF